MTGIAFPRMRPPEASDDATLSFLTTTKLYNNGRALNVIQVLSNHPPAAKALSGMLEWGNDAALSARDRRLLILRTAGRTRCTYEWSVHSQLARSNEELTDGEVAALAIADAVEKSTWSERERGLVVIADGICRSDTLSDAEWEACSQVLTAAQIIEALVVVGYYRMVGGLTNALAIPDESVLA